MTSSTTGPVHRGQGRIAAGLGAYGVSILGLAALVPASARLLLKRSPASLPDPVEPHGRS
jgi:hypothetical protein